MEGTTSEVRFFKLQWLIMPQICLCVDYYQVKLAAESSNNTRVSVLCYTLRPGGLYCTFETVYITIIDYYNDN